MIELKPLDTFETYKEVPFKLWPPTQPIEYAVDLGIKAFGESIYPGGIVDVNHVRIFVGYFDGVPVAFEWTYPKARFVVVQDWMVNPDYCRLQRYIPGHSYCSDWFLMEKIKVYLNAYKGSGYDWLQLAGIAMGVEWLQLSKNRHVCSVGARITQEHFYSTCLFPEIPTWRTPPCSWMNHPEAWETVNQTDSIVPIQSEPEILETWYSNV